MAEEPEKRHRMNHWERLQVAAFLYVNGCPPFLWRQWCELVHPVDAHGLTHMIELLEKYFETRRYNLYAWQVGMGRFEYLDGAVLRFTRKEKSDLYDAVKK